MWFTIKIHITKKIHLNSLFTGHCLQAAVKNIYASKILTIKF